MTPRRPSRRQRQRLAQGLERALQEADRCSRSRLTAVVPVQRAEIRASKPLILTLAAQLRQLEDPHPGGVVLTRRLLTDATGPLFAPAPPGTLWDTLEQAIVALSDERASEH
jgi:hypothetical protein